MLGSAPLSLGTPSTRSTARVGPRDDRTYWLWAGTTDDEGRLVRQTRQLHVLVVGCWLEFTGDPLRVGQC